MESRSSGNTSLIYGTWNPTWPDMKVLNTETPKGMKLMFIKCTGRIAFSFLNGPSSKQFKPVRFHMPHIKQLNLSASHAPESPKMTPPHLSKLL